MFEQPEDFSGEDMEGDIKYDDVYQEISDYADGEGGCVSTVIVVALGTAGLIYKLSVAL